MARLGERGAAAYCLHRDGLDYQRLARIDETELRAMRRLEGGFHRREIGCSTPWRRDEGRHDERCVGSRIADVRAHMDGDIAKRHALPFDLAAPGVAEPGAHLG